MKSIIPEDLLEIWNKCVVCEETLFILVEKSKNLHGQNPEGRRSPQGG